MEKSPPEEYCSVFTRKVNGKKGEALCSQLGTIYAGEVLGTRRKFLVRGERSETVVREIISPILRGVDRTTHKVTYRTSSGVVEIVSIPLKSSPGRYGDAAVSGALRKIILWNRDNTEELEQLLRSGGVDMVEIVKDGPKTLELKR